jgi:hypothetical protein
MMVFPHKIKKRLEDRARKLKRKSTLVKLGHRAGNFEMIIEPDTKLTS